MAKFSISSPFKFVWSVLKKSLFMIGLLVCLGYFGLIYSLSSNNDVTIDLPEQGFIVDMSINGEIVDYTPGVRNLALNLFNNGPKRFNINHLIKLIDRVAEDQRVKGFIINWSGAQSNLSHQTRLNDALTILRKKRPQLPVYFYSNNIDRGSLLISSTADRIAVPPVANFLITGPIMQLTYFGEAAEKLGIGFTVFQTGPHKAAFEPYIRSAPSPEVKQEYTQISQNITNDIVQRIDAGRDSTEDEIKSWFKQSIFTVKSALERNIVTDVTYLDQFRASLQTEVSANNNNSEKDVQDTSSLASIDAMQYLSSSDAVEEHKLAKSNSSKLAFIQAFGAISQQGSNAGNDDGIFAQDIIQQIEWAKNDPEIAAVVLRVTSPGGSAQASELIWHHLKQLAEVKPLVVSMGSVAASGGYYIAAAADTIVAESTTITGSIGVTAVMPELENLQEKIGVYVHTISDSDRKALLSIEEKPSALDVATVNAGIQEIYQIFLERVEQGRPLSLEQVENIAGGRIYTGKTAKSLGLVDVIGDTGTAFSIAKELAGLDPEKLYPIKPFTYEGKNIFSCVIQQGLDNCVTMSPLISSYFNPFQALQSSVSELSSFTPLLEVVKVLDAESKGPKKLTYIPINTNL